MPTPPADAQTLREEILAFLDRAKRTQSPATAASYHQALSAFSRFLSQTISAAGTNSAADITFATFQDFLHYLQQRYSPETEHAYLRAVVTFYQTMAADSTMPANLTQQLIDLSHTDRRKKLRHQPQIPYQTIQLTRQFLTNQTIPEPNPDTAIQRDRLRMLRDKALIFTIIDTGLKAHEVAKLKINDFNASTVSIHSHEVSLPIQQDTDHAIHDYLRERAPLDQQQHMISYSALPLFARHDKRAADHVLAISRWTVGNIITYWSRLAAEPRTETLNPVTPSLMRHHFVASTLEATHDLELVRQRAGHKDKGTTRHYLNRSPTSTD